MLYGNWTQFLHRAPSYSGTVIEGSETPEEAGERFYRMVIEVAPGTLARSETRYEYARPDPIRASGGAMPAPPGGIRQLGPRRRRNLVGGAGGGNARDLGGTPTGRRGATLGGAEARAACGGIHGGGWAAEHASGGRRARTAQRGALCGRHCPAAHAGKMPRAVRPHTTDILPGRDAVPVVRRRQCALRLPCSRRVIEGSETPEEAGERFYRMVIEVAPGTLARSETRYDTEPIDMSLQVLRF